MTKVVIKEPKNKVCTFSNVKQGHWFATETPPEEYYIKIWRDSASTANAIDTSGLLCTFREETAVIPLKKVIIRAD